MELGGSCRHGHELNEETAYVSPSGVVACRACKKDAAERFKAKKAGDVIHIPGPRHLTKKPSAKVCFWCERGIHVGPKASRFCLVHIDTGSSFCDGQNPDTSKAALRTDIGERKYKNKKPTK